MKSDALLLLLCFSCFSVIAFGQTPLGAVDYSRIKSKPIQRFLCAQQQKGVLYFEDFSPSVTAQTDSALFDSNVHEFKLRHNSSDAWTAYLSAHPATVWQGHVVSCKLVYSPREKLLVYPDDPYPGLEVGQVFFVEMRVLCGLVHFPVCFVVTRIDEQRRLISFSYVQGGASSGSQSIQLMEDSCGGTRILHSSIHQTENKFRDKTMYPIYHRKAIGEVHRNIRHQLGGR